MSKVKEIEKVELLEILGIPFEMRFSDRTFLELNRFFKPYELSHKQSGDANLHRPTIINIVEKSFDGLSAQKYINQRRRSISMVKHGNNYLFSFFTGQFLVDKDFLKVKLWSPYESEMSIERDGFENYNGDPTLRLIVWGRASQMNYCYVHGALVTVDNKYILFMGDSGVGKTTLSNLVCKEGATCLTEENPFISWKNDRPMVHGTPWPGIQGPYMPTTGALSAIFFLRHARQNQIKELSLDKTCGQLVHNARTFNWLPETIPSSIELIDKVARSVPAFDFGFVPDSSAIKIVKSVL